MTVADPLHRRAVALLSLAAFASSASARLCDPMLPELARTFAASPEATAQVVSSFAVAYGVLQLFFGPLGDRFGKYRLIAWTTLACILGSLGGVLASSLGWLVLARLLTGASAAGVIPLSMAWIGDTVAYEHRQATLARFMGGQILGTIGGQFIGGLFTDTLGWRWAFAAMALIYLVAGSWVLVESHSNETTRHRPGATGAGLAIFGQIRLVLGLAWARVVLLSVFLEGTLVFGGLAFIPSYLHQRFGLSMTMAGAVMACFAVGGFSYILFARHFVGRLGEVGLAAAGGLVIGAAWLILMLGASWAWALPGCYLVGLGFYMLHNTLQTNATQMAPRVRGTAVSLFASSLFMGQSLGVMLGASLLARAGAGTLFSLIALGAPVVGVGFAGLLRGQRRAG